VGFVKSQAAEDATRGNGSSEKSVCPEHVDDAVLKRLIGEYATEDSCSYCDRGTTDGDAIAASFDDFMSLFMVGIHHRYARADDEAVLLEEGEYVGATTYASEEVADDTLYAALSEYPDAAQDELLADIQAVMVPDTWVRLNWQWPSDEDRLSYGWDAFKELVKHQTRFLFIRWPKRDPYDLGEMSPLEFFESLVKLLNDLPEVIIDVDTPLYRGRMYPEEPDLKKSDVKALGPAPISKAGANRMSPAGISMFYGATDIETAVAEIGAHSSYSWAVVGEFKTTAGLRVVDLSNLPDLPSIFDSDEQSKVRYDELSFLRNFVEDLTLPIVLDGREHIDYVPTQVFTEYLRYSFPVPLDGLLYPSAQGPGRNVVLFCGPDACAAPDSVGPDTRLVLTVGSIRKYRVATVIRPTSGP
jgi:hypothetical protein